MGDFLEAVRERVVVYDGATGTNLQARDLSADDFGGPTLEGCNELLAVTRPAVIADLHRSFFEVGVDAVETDTFGAFPVVLAEYGIAERTFELNQAAARIAKEVASGYSTPDRPRWVVGSIGPGTKLPSLGQIDFVSLRDGYEAQVDGLLAGGPHPLRPHSRGAGRRPRPLHRRVRPQHRGRLLRDDPRAHGPGGGDGVGPHT